VLINVAGNYDIKLKNRALETMLRRIFGGLAD